MRPLLLLDVDGVLNPEFKPHDPPYCGCTPHRAWRRYKLDTRVGPVKVHLNPSHGPKLLALAAHTGAELAWATTWQDMADLHLAPILRLPVLPVATCPFAPEDYPDDRRGEWKARHIIPWTGGRPFVWFDDEPDAASAAAALADQPHLVIPVDERAGLSDDDIEAARRWLTAASY